MHSHARSIYEVYKITSIYRNHRNNMASDDDTSG